MAAVSEPPALRGPLPALPYDLAKPSLVVPPAIASRLSDVGDSFYQETGHTMVVMSGDRGPQAQADAMYDKFAGGDDGHVYRDQAAMKQIKDEFDRGRRGGLTKDQTVANMKDVTDGQVARGVLISKHMVGKAVDLRTEGLGRRRANLLMHIAYDHGFQTIHEGIPEHLHVQIH